MVEIQRFMINFLDIGISSTFGSSLSLTPVLNWLPGPVALAPQEAALMAQWVKSPPAVREAQEGLLREAMAAHPRVLAWEIPWTEEPGGLQPKGSQRIGPD